MKKLSMMLCSAMALTAGVLLAQTPAQPANILQWSKSAQSLLQNGVFKVSGRKALQSLNFKIDPTKTYTLTATFRTVNNAPDKARVYLGIMPIQANGREICSWNVNALPGTFTTVAAAAKKGDTILKVKDGSKFQTVSYACLVNKAKADFSDLPNHSMAGGSITSKVQKDGYWELTLSKPLIANFAQGDGIRQHRHGGYLYPAGGQMVGSEWQTASGSIQSIDAKGCWNSRRWPVGTTQARVILLVNWTNKKLDMELKDVTLTEK